MVMAFNFQSALNTSDQEVSGLALSGLVKVAMAQEEGGGPCYKEMSHGCSWGIVFVCKSTAYPSGGACDATAECNFC